MNMGDFTLWFTSILTFMLGFSLGTYHKHERGVNRTVRQVIAAKTPRPKTVVGQVRAPSAEDVRKKRSGEKAAEEAMEESLNNIPELNT